MKSKGYSVRVETDCVVVTYRMTLSGSEIGGLALLPVILAGLFLAAPGPSHRRDGFGGMLAGQLILAIVAVVAWLRGSTGEVIRCDGKELQFARRRMVGRWKRYRFPSGEVRGLQHAVRRRGRSYITVLTFQHDGQTFDMLETIGPEDARVVLKACKAMGMDAVEVPVDPGEGMLRDIEKRGWWVNPLKADRGEESDEAKG